MKRKSRGEQMLEAAGHARPLPAASPAKRVAPEAAPASSSAPVSPQERPGKLPRVVAAAKQDEKAVTAVPRDEAQLPQELVLLASMFGEGALAAGTRTTLQVGTAATSFRPSSMHTATDAVVCAHAAAVALHAPQTHCKRGACCSSGAARR